MQDNILKLKKDGEIAAGEYSIVDVSGNATNSGNICAKTIHISGNAELSDTIEASTVTIEGNLEFSGVLRAEELIVKGNAILEGTVEVLRSEILGNCDIKGEISMGDFTTKGNLLSVGKLTTKSCRINGTATGTGTIEAEEAEILGKLGFEGAIEAQVVRCKAYHKGFVKEIRAGQVEIFQPSLFKHPGSLLSREYFSIEKVECSVMYAEITGVSIVRGEDIQLAKKCVVEELYYLNSLTATENCQINFVEQIKQ